jgi:Asp-tRNA(Asn)/Glu-tRNA(Gln) amidotransferase A subunit family amidase
MAFIPVDPFTATASDLQADLVAGKFNCSQLIALYLSKISQYNDHLEAVIETAPGTVMFQEALRLDIERANRVIRGPLHGIPVSLKISSLAMSRRSIVSISQDNIATHPDLELEKTAGT